MNVARALALCFFSAAVTHAQKCYDSFAVFPGRLEGKEPTKYDMFEDINFQVADISECDSLLELTGSKFGDIGVLAIATAIESDEEKTVYIRLAEGEDGGPIDDIEFDKRSGQYVYDHSRKGTAERLLKHMNQHLVVLKMKATAPNLKIMVLRNSRFTLMVRPSSLRIYS